MLQHIEYSIWVVQLEQSFAQREPLAFFHVLAVIIEDEGAVFFGDFPRATGGMGIGENDLVTAARVGLPGDGRQAIVQQRLDVERRHDEAHARPWLDVFQIRLHDRNAS